MPSGTPPEGSIAEVGPAAPAGRGGSDSPAGPTRDSERNWKIAAGVAAVFLIGFIVFVVTRPHHARAVAYPVTAPAQLEAGTVAPSFSLPRLGGGQAVSLADTRGTPTVVNFFASWCKDCQAELSAFGALSAQTAGRVAIVGVDSNDTNPTLAQSLLTKAKATYPVGVDNAATVATSFLLSALPVTYFLDAQGRVVHVAFGAQSLASLEHWSGQLTGKSARP
jgi:cytochrome c biogenesis protein CcmG, thiol:disulfide interchange protein DsbE